MPEVRISSADATASHRDNAPGSTPGCSHTTDAGPPLYASSYTTPDGTLSVGLLLSDQVQKIARKTNTSSPTDVLLLLRIQKDHPIPRDDNAIS